ncbi:hypothetical protein [uncultured Bacteroides sp.]|uniref:hypothetical protein n=1 Tax=uncultured Bacteroides sp. TaxID=162156 RepID=UPI002AA60A90|nr:hypothetical protein [uncultured Bacteroides sp.]
MQTLLTDIELDVQELKYLIGIVSHEPGSPLKDVAKRNIVQMRARLDALLQQLNETDVVKIENCNCRQKEQENITLEKDEAPVKEVIWPAQETNGTEKPILAERIKSIGGLPQAMSLNDSFRFSRELFGGDVTRMSHVLQQLGDMCSLSEALAFLSSELDTEADEEVVSDFTELLKTYFINRA